VYVCKPLMAGSRFTSDGAVMLAKGLAAGAELLKLVGPGGCLLAIS